MPGSKQPRPAIPVGTKALTRVGGQVGVVISAPASVGGPYYVRFADGQEAPYAGTDLTIFNHEFLPVVIVKSLTYSA